MPFNQERFSKQDNYLNMKLLKGAINTSFHNPELAMQWWCMKMQWLVASPNCAFLTVISIGEESGCFGLRAADFEACCVFHERIQLGFKAAPG